MEAFIFSTIWITGITVHRLLRI